MSDQGEPIRRKESFDEVAEVYDSSRPGPPVPVLEALFELTQVGPESRVLEIGCGTGQLSVPLARRGVELVAVELGRNLAAIARRNLSRFPRARVDVSSFEAWTLPAESFDLVACSNAFHWLDPELRVSKSARALGPDRLLAVVHPHSVFGGTEQFFLDSQSAYVKWVPGTEPGFRMPAAENVPEMYVEIDHCDQFELVSRHRQTAEVPFTTSSYVGMLETDSMIRALAPASRDGFLADIGTLIDARYDGSVTRKYVYELIVWRRAPA